MNITIENNSLFSYKGRNRDIRSAQGVLHKIKSEYAASSPYVVNLLSKKHLNKPMSLLNRSNHKLYALRQVQENHMDYDCQYVKILLNLIKKARVANCKEFSELAFIIAKLNGMKDCNCVDFAQSLPNETFESIDHEVLLINQKVPKNKTRLHKFYAEDVTNSAAFIPSKKAIVIDPLYEIVDYWDNAVIQYQNFYPEICAKDLHVAARDSILKDKEDIQYIKQNFPELLINKKQTSTKSNLFKKIKDFIFNKKV